MVNPSSTLVLEVVVDGQHLGGEDAGVLVTEFQADRDQTLRNILHDQSSGGGLPDEGHLGDPVAECQRLASFGTEAVYDIDHTRRQQVTDE